MNPNLHHAFAGTDADLPLWRTLAARCGGPVLELGVGAGRVALDLRARGVEVVGVERDPVALAGVIRQDLRELSLDRCFPLIIAPARVLEELEPARELPGVLAACAEHLVPGGLLAAQVASSPPSEQPEQSMGVVHQLGPHQAFGPAEVLWQERLERARCCRRVQVSLRRGSELLPVGALCLHWADPATWDQRLVAAGLTPERPGSILRDALRGKGGELLTLLARKPNV